MLAMGQRVQIIDTRPRDYSARAHDILDRAVWRDPEHVDEWIGTLSKEVPVVTFCTAFTLAVRAPRPCEKLVLTPIIWQVVTSMESPQGVGEIVRIGKAVRTAGHDRAEALKGPKRRRLTLCIALIHAAPKGDSLIARSRAVDDDRELTPQSATGNRAWPCGRIRARLYGEATSDTTCMPYMPAIRMVHGGTSPRSRSQAEGSRSPD